MHTHHILKHLADAINPLLGVWLLVAIVAGKKLDSPTRALLFRCVLALLVVYIACHLNKRLHLWHAHPLFPSGHMGFSVCIATCLFWIRRNTLALTVPILIGQSILLVYLGFHQWIDILGLSSLPPR